MQFPPQADQPTADNPARLHHFLLTKKKMVAFKRALNGATSALASGMPSNRKISVNLSRAGLREITLFDN